MERKPIYYYILSLRLHLKNSVFIVRDRWYISTVDKYSLKKYLEDDTEAFDRFLYIVLRKAYVSFKSKKIASFDIYVKDVKQIGNTNY